jgi:transcriptional regulator with PAS, ATPase and Fis domain
MASRSPGTYRFRVSRELVSPVMVGREAEMAQLRAVLDRAVAAEPQVALVAGEAGVGKSRLVQEIHPDRAGLGRARAGRRVRRTRR